MIFLQTINIKPETIDRVIDVMTSDRQRNCAICGLSHLDNRIPKTIIYVCDICLSKINEAIEEEAE